MSRGLLEVREQKVISVVQRPWGRNSAFPENARK